MQLSDFDLASMEGRDQALYGGRPTKRRETGRLKSHEPKVPRGNRYIDSSRL